MNLNIFVAIAFLVLAVERFGLALPPVLAGLIFLAAAIASGLF